MYTPLCDSLSDHCGGRGASHIETLMIYRNGIGPKCAPDVSSFKFSRRLNLCFSQELFCTICFLKLSWKVKSWSYIVGTTSTPRPSRLVSTQNSTIYSLRHRLGGAHEDPHHNFVLVSPMIKKFGTGLKLDVFCTMATKMFVTSLLLRNYDVLSCI